MQGVIDFVTSSETTLVVGALTIAINIILICYRSGR